jgi:hypothetical protein
MSRLMHGLAASSPTSAIEDSGSPVNEKRKSRAGDGNKLREASKT